MEGKKEQHKSIFGPGFDIHAEKHQDASIIYKKNQRQLR